MDLAQQESPSDSAAPSRAALDAAYAFASTRGRPAAMLILAGDEPIGTPNVRELARSIGDLELDELDLVIHSSGGDIHAAYQLVAFLRRRVTRKLYACVPRYARSAATLLCIGCDAIVLDELAGLGPLDAQILDGTNGDRLDYKSALVQFKSLERLRTFSLESLRAAAEMLYDKNVTNTDDVLRYGMEFVEATSVPLFEKIPSQKLGDFSQALSIAEEYGVRLLAKVPHMAKKPVREIARRLVHDYPSHECVIDCEELRDLGFEAGLFEGKERIVARKVADHYTTRLVRLVDHREPPVREPPDEPVEEHLPTHTARQVYGDAIGPARVNPWADSQNTKALPPRGR